MLCLIEWHRFSYATRPQVYVWRALDLLQYTLAQQTPSIIRAAGKFSRPV
jgi:hypothetical protein